MVMVYHTAHKYDRLVILSINVYINVCDHSTIKVHGFSFLRMVPINLRIYIGQGS